MIGERLKKLREEKGLSQSKLAEELGFKSSTIGKYEIDQREPNFNTLVRICNYFNCTTDYLLGVSDSKQNNHSSYSISGLGGFDNSKYTNNSNSVNNAIAVLINCLNADPNKIYITENFIKTIYKISGEQTSILNNCLQVLSDIINGIIQMVDNNQFNCEDYECINYFIKNYYKFDYKKLLLLDENKKDALKKIIDLEGFESLPVTLNMTLKDLLINPDYTFIPIKFNGTMDNLNLSQEGYMKIHKKK